jgi:hypothetical protein
MKRPAIRRNTPAEMAVWNRTHPDYRTVTADGRRAILYLNPATGATVLIPLPEAPILHSMPKVTV